MAALVSCASRAPAPAFPRPRTPPPRVLTVAVEQVGLRANAWLELHAWLAAAARERAELEDPELNKAARAYAEVLAEDDRDEALGRTAAALAACEDERCARAAVTGTRFATPYLESLPGFLTSHWTERATIARQGVELARAALGPEIPALVKRLADDLAIAWPASPAVVDIVGDAPPAGREAPIRALLGARGSCFAKDRAEPVSVYDARIIDCVLAHAAVRLESRSALATALAAEMGRAGEREFRRAWTALVVHAVAVTVTGLEPKHTSTQRRSVAAVMPEAMTWLAREWPSRMRGETSAAFAKRYAAALGSSP